MRKLKLAVDDLKVESFDTSRIGEVRGTVAGASGIQPASEVAMCLTDTEVTGPCCDASLMVSCATDCDGMATCYPQCAVLETNTCIE